MLERYHTDLPPRRRRARCRGEERGSPRSSNGWRRSAPRSARTCWPTSRPTRCALDRRGRTRRPARFHARGDEGRSAGARPRRPRRHAVALERRAVPAILRAGATCAKRCSAPSSRAATTAARPTTRRSSPRWCGCAPSARSCSAIADFAHYRLDDAMAKTPEAVRDLLDTVWAPARARALADRDAMQALVQEEGGNFALAPGTGATTPRSCASGAAISTRPRSSPTSSSTA